MTSELMSVIPSFLVCVPGEQDTAVQGEELAQEEGKAGTMGKEKDDKTEEEEEFFSGDEGEGGAR